MKTLEEEAKQYAKNNKYDLEMHDESGYLGISEETFAKKLADFATNSEWLQVEKLKMELAVLENVNGLSVRQVHVNQALCILNQYENGDLEWNKNTKIWDYIS